MNRWFESFFKKKDGPKNKGISFQYVAAVLALGVGLMLFGNFFGGHSSKKTQTAAATAKQHQPSAQATFGQKGGSAPSSVIEYEHYYENQLKQALDKVYGISNVIVQVHVTTSQMKVVGKNNSVDSQTTTEKDKQGGTRQTNQSNKKSDPVIINGNNGDKPLILGTKQPHISGVLVVAGGGDQPQVQLWIKEAVHSLLGVPEYRITVLPKKQGRNES